MFDLLLTQNSTPIFKYIVWILGKIMNYIFEFLSLIRIPNIGIAIILFTIIMYLLLMPLTVKQQKFSKLSGKMNPELQAIQAKYKNRKDQESMMAMNQETKAVYAKYGVSPTGSCLQLIIQMPVLFALYRVIYSMPAYVSKLHVCFEAFVNKLTFTDVDFFRNNISSFAYYSKQFPTAEAPTVLPEKFQSLSDSFIDVINRASSSDWKLILEHYNNDPDAISCQNSLNTFNNFLGLNIGDSPSVIIKNALAVGSYLLVAGAILIPILAAVTQWINVKLAPQPQQNPNDPNGGGAMASSLKTMNLVMPIMSAIFCFTLPAGMGIYWIAGAVVRTIQQIVINKRIDSMDVDQMMKDNVDKYNEKLKKRGLPPAKVNAYANMNTKKVVSNKPEKTQEEKDEMVKKSTEFYNKNTAKPGSLAAKANMVKQYNEKNNK